MIGLNSAGAELSSFPTAVFGQTQQIKRKISQHTVGEAFRPKKYCQLFLGAEQSRNASGQGGRDLLRSQKDNQIIN
jgi:hypothetical protein